MTLTFDHIAVCCTNLSEGTQWVQDQLGARLSPGGTHPYFGTHNALLRLDDLYLEVIARNPEAPETGRASWFGLDQFTGPPRLANWVCRTDDLGAAPAHCGPPRVLARGDLRWQITVPEDGSLPYDGAYPTLIRWGQGTRHPVDRLPDSDLRLTRLRVLHPDAQTIQNTMDLSDQRVSFVTGPTGFSAEIDTPFGPKTLC